MPRGRFAATAGVERPGLWALLGLVLLPVLVGGLPGWALADPTAERDRIVVALVNEDEPVQIEGETVPVGRQFAAALLAAQEPPAPSSEPDSTAGAGDPSPEPASSPEPSSSASLDPAETPTFTWVLTNADDADAGLGRDYDAVVTIPSDFSAAATSLTAGTATARSAAVLLRTSPAAAWLDAPTVRTVLGEAVALLGEQITEQYLSQVYGGFNEIGTQIDSAADGAASVATGAAEVNEGAGALADGTGELADAAAPLAPESDDLADGADEVADGVAEAAGAANAAANSFARAVGEICGTPGPVCDRAGAALDALDDAADQLGALSDGADSVANGADALAGALPMLVEGLDESASGMESLASGTADVDDGAQQVADGLATATTSIPTYSDDDITVLSTVAASPVILESTGDVPGLPSVPVFATLGLWIGGIASSLVLPPVPPRRLLTGASSMRIAARAMLPTVLLGAAGGAALGGVLLFVLSVSTWRAWVLVVAAAAVGIMAALVNQALGAVLGGAGRFLAAAVAVVFFVTELSSTVAPALGTAAGLLPTHPARGLLQTVAVDTVPAMAPFAIGTVLFGIAAALVILAATSTRRRAP